MDPTALSVKNALLPTVLRSVVHDMVEKETDRRIPHLLLAFSHSLDAIPVRILLGFLNEGDSPKTMMNDILAFKLYLYFPA